MQGVWWSHCFNAGGFHCYKTEKIVRRLASADVGNGVTVTDLINLSPSTMQIVGAFEILSVIVGWSSSNVRFWSLKFKPANLWAWQNLGFAKTSVAHSSGKETLLAVGAYNHVRPLSKELQHCVRFPEERLELATM